MADAQRMLRTKKLTPLSISQGVTGAIAPSANVKSSPLRRARGAGAFNAEALRRFTSETAVLLRAGLPLDRSIKVQIDALPSSETQSVLTALLDGLKGGKPLSQGLEQHPGLFNFFYINMVRAGEASGRLSEVLTELVTYLERAKAIRSSVLSAITYPAILASVAAISIFVMLAFVVPEFETLFEDMGDSLPLLTQLIVSSGDIFSRWGALLLALGAVAGIIARRWLRSPAGQEWRDIKALSLPLLGSVILRYEISRFAGTMGTLLANGVTVLNAAGIAVGTVGNGVVRRSLEPIPAVLKRGGKLSSALDEKFFSPAALQMVKVGEESGDLGTMLLEMSKVYESEVEAEIKRALTVLEPALILGMGAVIALIIMGILMGILSVNTLIV